MKLVERHFIKYGWWWSSRLGKLRRIKTRSELQLRSEYRSVREARRRAFVRKSCRIFRSLGKQRSPAVLALKVLVFRDFSKKVRVEKLKLAAEVMSDSRESREGEHVGDRSPRRQDGSSEAVDIFAKMTPEKIRQEGIYSLFFIVLMFANFDVRGSLTV